MTPEIRHYTYHNENAEIIGRYIADDIGKQWQIPDGDGWLPAERPANCPPYRLHQLLASGAQTIVVAESEQDADVLAGLGLVTTCAPTEIDPSFAAWFAGRNVVLVHGSGHDWTRRAASMHKIAASVRGVFLRTVDASLNRAEFVEKCRAAEVFKSDAVDPSSVTTEIDGKPWTLDAWCDAGHDGKVWLAALEMQLAAEAAEQEAAWAADWAAKYPGDIEPPDHEDIGPPPGEYSGSIGDPTAAPFLCLGYDDGMYYFLPHRTQQVQSISAGGITSAAQLLGIAPLEYWQHAAPNKSSVDWTVAGNLIIRWCETRGQFDANSIRGRGAWFDAGRSVLHLGNRLLVDGVTTGLHQIDSRFIYERGNPIESLDNAPALGNDDATRLMAVMRGMNWSKSIDPVLFAGFCVLAPICGALAWRPHAWLTAQRGAGKTWAQTNIIGPLLGHTAMYAQGSSTEAYLRQAMKRDGFSLVLDEMDSKSIKDRERLQKIIELARASSSDSLAGIGRGSANGKASSYKPRSMFLMVSINTALAEASDKSRFTVLSLKPAKQNAAGVDQFEKLKALVDSTLTPDYCSALRSRTYSLIPIIRANAQVLAKAAAEHIGNQRAGDQIGALLAGAYSLRTRDKISMELARKWVRSENWQEQTDDREDSDEFQLCAELLHAQLRVDTRTGVKLRSVAELFELLEGAADADVLAGDADAALVRTGLRLKDGQVYVSESHRDIKALLRDSAWAGGWARVLERVPGAQRHQSVRFAGVRHRAVSVPVEAMRGAIVEP